MQLAADLARVTRGLAVHEYMAPAYGLTVPRGSPMGIACASTCNVPHAPDDYFDELRMEYESDDGLRVPATVFNSRLNRSEMA
jgi:hypothetical protein